MLPIFSGGHSAYQDTFVSDFIKYHPNPYALSKSSWDTIVEFWYMDLSLTDILMQDSYLKYGPKPRLPSCMLCSYLLSIKFKVTFVTDWAAKLKECPHYAILSGFDPHDTPGVGTFYDFFTRLWQSDQNNHSPKERFPKPKVKKGKKTGDKTPADTDTISSRNYKYKDTFTIDPDGVPRCRKDLGIIHYQCKQISL